MVRIIWIISYWYGINFVCASNANFMGFFAEIYNAKILKLLLKSFNLKQCWIKVHTV